MPSIGPSKDFKLEPSQSNSKIDKQAVLYIHIDGTNYQCRDCILFITNNHCLVHRKDDKILPSDSCGLFIYGEPAEEGTPLGIITPEQSGLTHSENDTGFSCKQCEYFGSQVKDCQKVNKDSEGDDPGIIHPDACCNNWDSNDEQDAV